MTEDAAAAGVADGDQALVPAEEDRPLSSSQEGLDVHGETGKRNRAAAVQRPYPRRTLEDAVKVAQAIRTHNGGNAWNPDEIARAVGVANSTNFYYLTASSRDYGLTEGTARGSAISLTELGRRAVYPDSPQAELEVLRIAFMRVEIFRKVVEFYRGSKLPEKPFLTNALESTFGLNPRTHDEFTSVFTANCRYLSISADYDTTGSNARVAASSGTAASTPLTETVAAPPGGASRTCFVIMPFVERSDAHSTGFFEEVLEALFKPAATAAGFTVKTAKRQGSDIIQSTIVSELLKADLVLADLTEHNPNVLFELGMRMAKDLPVALVRAKGTGRIFDVDNMLRVEDYSPNLWPSTVEQDVPRLTSHILATWEDRDTMQTFMKLLG